MSQPADRSFLVLFTLLGSLVFLYFLSYYLTPEAGNAVAANPIQADVGGRDFPVYWAAWQIHRNGGNIYSLETTRSFRSDPIEFEDVIHNPPWALWLVAPIAWLPFQSAHTAWLVINFVFIPVTIFLALKLFRLPAPRPAILLVLCLFAPTFSCWYYGQLTIILTAITYLMLLCHRKKWDWATGFCLALMTIKPHIYYLLALVVGLYALWQWRWKVFAGFISTMSVLLFPFRYHSDSLSNWQDWLGTGQATLWMTTTISTWIRILLAPESGLPPAWPIFLIPALSLAGCLIWFWTKRHREPDWARLCVPLLALSLLTAPYSWAYDYCLLICWHVACISIPSQKPKLLITVSTAATLLFLFQVSQLQGDMHWLIWFPFIVLASWPVFGWTKSSNSHST